MCELITQMHALAERCVADGRSVSFPANILPRVGEEPLAYRPSPDYANLFPENPAFAEYEVRRLQSEVGDLRDARGALKIENLRLQGQIQSISHTAQRLLEQVEISDAA